MISARSWRRAASWAVGLGRLGSMGSGRALNWMDRAMSFFCMRVNWGMPARCCADTPKLKL